MPHATGSVRTYSPRGVARRRATLLVVSAMVMAGCATPYQHKTFRGGYAERQMSENVFEVSFRGNTYSGKQQVSDLCLLRSAQVALEHGFRYFVITNVYSELDRRAYTAPVPYATAAGPRGELGLADLGTPFVSTTSYVVANPTVVNVIAGYAERPEADASVVDAEATKAVLMKKYGISE